MNDIEQAKHEILTAQACLDVALDYLTKSPPDHGQAPAEETPDGYLSPHFRESEFTCNHCNSLEGHTVAQELLAVLEACRAHFDGAPVTVNSGYRCQVHNTNVGSTEHSQHRKATAADIVVTGVSPSTVHAYFSAQYPGKYGLGRYNSFTHIDVRTGPARW